MSAITASPLEFESCPSLARDSLPDRAPDRSPDQIQQPVELVLVKPRTIGNQQERRTRAVESQQLFRRTLCASLAVHLSVVVGGWFILNTYVGSKDEVAIPPALEHFDISIIPLSALETVLPQGAPVAAIAPPQPQRQQEISPEQKEPTPITVDKPVLKKNPEKRNLAQHKPDQKTAPSQDARSEAATVASNAQSSTQQPGFVNGTGPSHEKARINYQEAIASLLARAKRYPERALRRGMTGEATIRIEIRADGSLMGFEILRSAGASVLDEELRAMVDRASPFPSFPQDLQKQSLALVVPVAFTIK